MNAAGRWLRVLLGVGAFYHVALGALVMLAKEWAPEIARSAFRFHLAPTPEILWMMNPFGAYLLAFGLVMGVAAADPIRFRPVVGVVVALYALRLVQRTWFLCAAEASLRTLDLGAQAVVHLVVVGAMAIGMAGLSWRARAAGP